jgi:hypothetical protein
VCACCGPCGLARLASPGGSTACAYAADRHAALTDADATVIECANPHAYPNRHPTAHVADAKPHAVVTNGHRAIFIRVDADRDRARSSYSDADVAGRRNVATV